MSATSLWDNSVILAEDWFQSCVLFLCTMFPFFHVLQILGRYGEKQEAWLLIPNLLCTMKSQVELGRVLEMRFSGCMHQPPQVKRSKLHVGMY